MKELIKNNKLLFSLFCITHLLALFLTKGHLHADEHFQILEFMNYKLKGLSGADLPWEFKEQMRSWFLPYFYLIISKLLITLQIISPFIHIYFFKFVSIVLGMWATIEGILFFSPTLNVKEKNIYIFCALCFWFNPFIHSRISSEAIASSLLFLGFIKLQDKEKYGTIVSGVLLGLSFIIRFHVAFCIAPMMLYFRKDLKKLGLWILMFIVTVIFGFLIDSLGYEHWVVTQWNYIYQNIFLHKASNYGVTPWWTYFLDINKKAIFPFGLIIVVTTLIFWWKNKKNLVTFATLPFFIIHSLISHKEWRFLIPLIPLIPYILAKTLASLPDKKIINIGLKSLAGLNILLLLMGSMRSVHPSFDFYQYLDHKNISQIDYLGMENPMFIHQLKVNYFNMEKRQAHKTNREELKFERPIFVSEYKDYLYLRDNNSCHILYSEIDPNSVKMLEALQFGFIRKQLDRSKHWALFDCQTK